MFEFDQYEGHLHRVTVTPTLPYEPLRNIERMSVLVWGEHCVECAAPACFQSCDLYQPRPDGRCRRFSFGAFRNRHFKSFRGYGAEVSLKKWAKIEARGNTWMQPVRWVLFMEQLVELGSHLIRKIGYCAFRITKDIRWRYVSQSLQERLCRWLHSRTKKAKFKPDAFVLETYNPGPETIRMQLNMKLAKEARPANADQFSLQPQYSAALTFDQGFSRHIIEARQFQSVTESDLPFDIALTPDGDNSAHFVLLLLDFVQFEKKSAVRTHATQPVKCVVFDLDNTLWKGTLIENDQVEPNLEITSTLKSLDARGILLSIASKNNYDLAWRQLEELGMSSYFLYPQIDWSPKSQALRQIATSLNIGLDSIAFVDDSPFELQEVSTVLPLVTCVQTADFSRVCGQDARFSGSSSPDARLRRRYYQDSIRREQASAAMAGDYLGFLETCQIQLEITPYSPSDFDRVSELVQRTNQLNFSGTKYSREDLKAILRNHELRKLVLRCSDRYGSYGTVGFGLVNLINREIRIEDLMLSCRIQGKLIEHAFFHSLAEYYEGTSIWINFKRTDRNSPAWSALESLHFETVADRAGLLLDLTRFPIARTSVEVRRSGSETE